MNINITWFRGCFFKLRILVLLMKVVSALKGFNLIISYTSSFIRNVLRRCKIALKTCERISVLITAWTECCSSSFD